MVVMTVVKEIDGNVNGISSCSPWVRIRDRLLVDEPELSGPPLLPKLLVVEKQRGCALVSLLVNNLQVSRLPLLSPHLLKVEVHAWTSVSSSPRHHRFQFFYWLLQ